MKTLTSIVFAIASFSVQAATELRIPYFPPAANCIHVADAEDRCSSPVSNGYIHITNHGSSAASVVIKGRDEGGADRGSYTASVPAYGIVIVSDTALEGTSGLSDGVGRWSLTITSEGDVSVVPFRRMGSIKIPLPVERMANNPPLPSLSFNQTLSTTNCEKAAHVATYLYVDTNENFRRGRHELLLAYQRGSSGNYIPITADNWHLSGYFHLPSLTHHHHLMNRYGWDAYSGVPKPLSTPFAGRWLDVVSGTMGQIVNVDWCSSS